MVYNGILMETVGISVMVSIGLLLFVFLQGIQWRYVKIIHTKDVLSSFTFSSIINIRMTNRRLWPLPCFFNVSRVLTSRLFRFSRFAPPAFCMNAPSREHTICVAASQLKCCKGTFISNTFSRLRHEAYGSSIKKGSVDIEKQWKRTAKEGF